MVSAGLDQCEQISVEAKQRAETRESSIGFPPLQSRNKTCNHLRKSQHERNHKGMDESQCQCPNGTLGNDHSICAPGQTNCSACDNGYWMKIGAFNKCNKLKKCNTNQYQTVAPDYNRDRQ